ncbi:MAG: hypothetical protein SGARI_006706, partial [Bacillariaceae sp.]
ILLLDEATSALDSESEKIVQESIDQITAKADLTTIMIAHRLSSIKKCDRIAVILDGKVKEIGTYEELMAKPKGHFRHLQQIQFGDNPGAMKTRKKKDKKKKKQESKAVNEKETDEDSIDKQKASENAKRARLMAKNDGWYFCIGGIGAIFAGAVYPAWGCKCHAERTMLLVLVLPFSESFLTYPFTVIFAYMIELLYTRVPTGLSDQQYDDIVDDMKTLAGNIAFGSLATIVASLFGNILLYYGFGVAVERMNQRVRDNAFKSLCRQECGYFDANPVGKITSELQDDAALVHSFTGEPIRSLVVSLSSVL